MSRRELIGVAALLTLCLNGTNACADGSDFKVGVEGFWDRYREPISPGVLVDERTNYGSVTARYSYNIDSNFIAVEGRGSYGKDDYKSPSGAINNIPQYEADVRLLGGIRVPVEGTNTVIISYLGLGERYFFDNNKGNFSSLGLEGYDRRITQFYVPLGVGMEITDDGWIYSPTIEFDPMFFGTVKSRLGEVPGLTHITNNQHEGYGWRSEFTVGQKYEDFGWEAGPFMRYWNIRESDVKPGPNGTYWVEPHNTRLQAGALARVTF